MPTEVCGRPVSSASFGRPVCERLPVRSPAKPLAPAVFLTAAAASLPLAVASRISAAEDSATDPLERAKAVERRRIEVIEKVRGTVVAIFPKNLHGGGSGVIIDRDGFALTNFHVVQPIGKEGWGGLPDGRLYPLRVIGIAPTCDLALVKLSGRLEFPAAPLGDSDSVRPGDRVMAMGNPFSLAQDYTPTVTLGVVSGTGRYQPGQGGVGVYANCIQTDASINPGNSGGPLFNMRGELIGINGRGSFEERGRVNVGVGYAISINHAKNFLADLYAGKMCRNGTLGATFRDAGDDGPAGVICEKIFEDSEIARKGLRLGSRLLRFDGVQIATANQFANLIGTMPIGQPVEVEFETGGEIRKVVVRLEGLPLPKPPPSRRTAEGRPAPAPGGGPAPAPGRGPVPVPGDGPIPVPGGGPAPAPPGPPAPTPDAPKPDAPGPTPSVPGPDAPGPGFPGGSPEGGGPSPTPPAPPPGTPPKSPPGAPAIRSTEPFRPDPAVNREACERIIRRYIAAIGGSEAISRTAAFYWEGIRREPDGKKAAFRLIEAADGRFLLEIGPPENCRRIGFDGSEAWTRESDGTVAKLPPEEAAAAAGLVRTRIAIAGRAAFQHIGDID
ncbi:MAG: trypsin-like peptidase domain-containing protein, partial [Planctomycetota bacterium]|nr:trypsin-like peptidase domain-containing protein [Planctomycetota bacterium]